MTGGGGRRPPRLWIQVLFLVCAVLSGAAGGLGLWMSKDLSSWGVLPAIALARIGLPLSVAGMFCWAVAPRHFVLLSWIGLALLILPWILLARLTL